MSKKQEKKVINALLKYAKEQSKLVKIKKIHIPKKYKLTFQKQIRSLKTNERRVNRLIGEKVTVIYQPSSAPIQVVGLTGKIVRVIQDVLGYKVYEVAFKTKVPSYSFRTGKPVLTFSETDVEFLNPKLRSL